MSGLNLEPPHAEVPKPVDSPISKLSTEVDMTLKKLFFVWAISSVAIYLLFDDTLLKTYPYFSAIFCFLTIFMLYQFLPPAQLYCFNGELGVKGNSASVVKGVLWGVVIFGTIVFAMWLIILLRDWFGYNVLKIVFTILYLLFWLYIPKRAWDAFKRTQARISICD